MSLINYNDIDDEYGNIELEPAACHEHAWYVVFSPRMHGTWYFDHAFTLLTPGNCSYCNTAAAVAPGSSRRLPLRPFLKSRAAMTFLVGG